MVFSSLFFIFAFLCPNLLIYFCVRDTRKRNVVLLIFSLIFYSWGGVRYLFLLLGMALVSWYTALRIGKEKEKEDGGTAKRWLTAECVILLGLLGIFKYTGFLFRTFDTLTGLTDFVPEIALPIGISFYTFQLLSYVIDVYRGDVAAQPKYWKVLLYCSLFHQCIAGPIVRYSTVAEEIDSRRMTLKDFSSGIRRFAVGLAKKAILANSCASVADTLLASADTAPVSGLWLGMLFYMFQIYLDFSAYSDMAIGMGRMVGFHYLENFNYPYISASVQEFWRRWHISLSTFFRDYVYIPLGGNRRGNLITVRNMFIVWFLTGMWHGASWNYILWGLYFFVFLVLERFLLKPLLQKLPRAVGWLYAMFVVLIGWVLFRFEDIGQAGRVLSGMFGAGGRSISSISVHYTFLNNIFLMIFCAIACTPLGAFLHRKIYTAAEKRNRPAKAMYWLDAVTPAVLTVLSFIALVGDSYNPFLYFQF
ncbi:MAG: MBOAT family O-acyltransferase [Lachnospiraceae bacterium]|jgi:alginate O-acetyltransferase complex protein AlgI